MAEALGVRRRRRADGRRRRRPARTIAWTSDDAWRPGRGRRCAAPARRARRRRDRPCGAGLVLRDGEVAPRRADADPASRLRSSSCAAAAAAAPTETVDRPGVARAPVAERAGAARPVAARRRATASSSSLLAGRPADPGDRGARPARAVGADPSRSGSRCGRGRSATRTTASPSTGTCCETAANAAALVDRVDRPDLLVLGALLHDIGKGVPGRPHRGRHRARRPTSARAWASRRTTSTCSPSWCATTCCCPTSPPAATSTTPRPSRGSPSGRRRCSTLQLLAALTEADSLATGPAAWGPWKARARRAARRPRRPTCSGRRAPSEHRRDDVPDRATSSRGSWPAATGRSTGDGDRAHRRRPPTGPGLFSRVAGRARAARPRRVSAPPPLERRRHGARRVPGRVDSGPRRIAVGPRSIARPRAGARRPPRPPGPPGRAGPRLRRPPTPCRGGRTTADGQLRQRRVAHRHRDRGARRRRASACSTGSPGPSPSSTSTSAPPRSRPSGRGRRRLLRPGPAGSKLTEPLFSSRSSGRSCTASPRRNDPRQFLPGHSLRLTPPPSLRLTSSPCWRR